MGGGRKTVGGRDSREERRWLFVFSNSEKVGERGEIVDDSSNSNLNDKLWNNLQESLNVLLRS